MTANYKIEIFKKVSNNRSLKISEYIYPIVYTVIFIVYIIHSLWKGNGWAQWQIGVTALLLAFTSYLRVTGKTVYKRYFVITDKDIKWQRAIFRDRKSTRLNSSHSSPSRMPSSA